MLGPRDAATDGRVFRLLAVSTRHGLSDRPDDRASAVHRGLSMALGWLRLADFDWLRDRRMAGPVRILRSNHACFVAPTTSAGITTPTIAQCGQPRIIGTVTI